MAAKAFEAAVRAAFAPRLAELGFVRHGVRYFRPCPPWGVQGLLLQQDKWNGTGFCRFSILLRRSLKLGTDRARLVERAKADAHFFDTGPGGAVWLGLLTEARQDFQYDYPPGDPERIAAVLDEALTDIARYGLPWLRWGFGQPFRPRDASRPEAAEARWQAFLADPPAGQGQEDGPPA